MSLSPTLGAGFNSPVRVVSLPDSVAVNSPMYVNSLYTFTLSPFPHVASMPSLPSFNALVSD